MRLSFLPFSKPQPPPWLSVPHRPSQAPLFTTLYRNNKTPVRPLKTNKSRNKNEKQQVRNLHNLSTHSFKLLSMSNYTKDTVKASILYNDSPNSSAFFSFSFIISCVRASGGKITSVGRGARGGGLASGWGIKALSLLKASSNDMACSKWPQLILK
jgi:hypothetical protein